MAIQGFGDRRTRRFFDGDFVSDYQGFERQAQAKLGFLDDADNLGDLTRYPGNRLERLKGDRIGQYSIRINRQWRICFRWGDAGPYEVEIVDYH